MYFFFEGGGDGLIFIEVEVNAWWLIRNISKELMIIDLYICCNLLVKEV